MHRVMAALECRPDAVFMMDSNFRVNFVNPAFHRVTGYTIEDVIGQTADMFRDISEGDQITEWKTALENGRDWSGEMTNVRVDGHRYPVAVSAAPVRERNGNLIGYASFERDITENRKIQEQLFQSQKMETVGTLAAGMAHDFNNLLQAIRGNIKLLLADQAIPDDARQKLRQVSDAASRAADITRQLLSFSRASEDKTEVIDLNQLIEDAGQLARHKLERAIDIEVQPAEIGAEPGATLAHCLIEDTGGGIPQELMKKIFDPFFTTKPAGKGTGLGLASVHKAVSEAKGLLEVDSRPGDGTTFHLYLPLAAGAAAPEEESDQPDIVKGSGRILLVDDEEFVLTFTQHCLVAAGYEVLTA